MSAARRQVPPALAGSPPMTPFVAGRGDAPGPRRLVRRTRLCDSRSQRPVPPSTLEQIPLALSIPEAAKMLGISRSLAYELAARGELHTVRLGRRIVVPRDIVLKMLGIG